MVSERVSLLARRGTRSALAGVVTSKANDAHAIMVEMNERRLYPVRRTTRSRAPAPRHAR